MYTVRFWGRAARAISSMDNRTMTNASTAQLSRISKVAMPALPTSVAELTDQAKINMRAFDLTRDVSVDQRMAARYLERCLTQYPSISRTSQDEVAHIRFLTQMLELVTEEYVSPLLNPHRYLMAAQDKLRTLEARVFSNEDRFLPQTAQMRQLMLAVEQCRQSYPQSGYSDWIPHGRNEALTPQSTVRDACFEPGMGDMSEVVHNNIMSPRR